MSLQVITSYNKEKSSVSANGLLNSILVVFLQRFFTGTNFSKANVIGKNVPVFSFGADRYFQAIDYRNIITHWYKRSTGAQVCCIQIDGSTHMASVVKGIKN